MSRKWHIAATWLLLVHLNMISNAVSANVLTIAVGETAGFYPAKIAITQGYFNEEGLQVKAISCINGKRCLKHLTDGEAQISTTADMPLVLAAHEGKNFGIFATMCTSAKDHVFLVRSDSGIKTPADLRGQRIAYVPGMSSHYFTDTFLNFHGIGTNDVRRVTIDPSKIEDQTKARAYDAAGLYEPLATYAINSLEDTWLIFPNPRLYTASYNLIADNSVSDQTLIKVLRAINKAIEFVKANPDQAVMMHGTNPTKYNCNLRLSQTLLGTLEAQSRWAIREHLVPVSPVPDF
jgi:NitT/TauT family transport system substrate-binding protein